MAKNSPPTTPGQHFFAAFGLDGSPGCLVRKETRIYYHAQNPAAITRKAGRCAGVVWMCNPGSAGSPVGPSPWGVLAPDPTLRAVLSMYQQAVKAKASEVSPGQNDYLLILNCFYAVDKNHAAGYAQWLASKCTYGERVPKKARFVVAAWGADKPQGPVWCAVRAIRRQRKRRGSSPFVVYINAPALRTNPARLSSRLAEMNYPLHPLNHLFAGSPPNLAAALAHHL